MFTDEITTLMNRSFALREQYLHSDWLRWKMPYVRGGNDSTMHLFDVLKGALERHGWYVQTVNDRRQYDSGGWCHGRLGEIYVRPSYKNTMFINLAHEATHALDFGTYGVDRLVDRFGHYELETRAEATAYVIANYCGVGVKNGLIERSSDYLAYNRESYNKTIYDCIAQIPDIDAMAQHLLLEMGF